MILVYILCFLFVTFGFLLGWDYFVGSSKAVERKATVKKIANQDAIKELEEDIFGVDKVIASLPGYSWMVTKADESMNLIVYLRNEKQIIVKHEEISAIAKTFVSDYDYAGYHQTHTRSVEEMDAAIQEAMKSMVKREIAEQSYDQGIKDLLNKYNGQPATASAVQDKPNWTEYFENY